MPLRVITIPLTVILLLVLGEIGMGVWRHSPTERSTAPVFSLPPAVAKFDKPGKFAKTIEIYGADRGAEWHSTAPDGTRIDVAYFEWDAFRVRYQAIKDIAVHAPELCNTAAGFELQEILPERSYLASNQEVLRFDTTKFLDPSGRVVFVFKMFWLQGKGTVAFREHGFNRLERAKNSLLRHNGAARVLQAGVFDAQTADQAWEAFRSQVLDHLEW